MEKEVFKNEMEEIEDKLINVLINIDDAVGTSNPSYKRLESIIAQLQGFTKGILNSGILKD